MKTLEELIIASKCRKGPSQGTSRDGAFWLIPCSETGARDNGCRIRSFGSDGIGQNMPDFRNFLTLRHYRNGLVMSVVRCHSWHQNSNDRNTWVRVPGLLGCKTVEEVIVALKKDTSNEAPLYSDQFWEELSSWLEKLGMVIEEPAPDEGDWRDAPDEPSPTWTAEEGIKIEGGHQ